MNEHLHNSAGDFDPSFDIADLGEPTPETMTAFFSELEAVKKIGTHKTIELGKGSDPLDPLPSGELQRTTLLPIREPGYTGPHLSVSILDGPSKLLEEVADQGFGPLIEIAYTDATKEITYTLPHGGEPTLYVKDKTQTSIDKEAEALLASLSGDRDPLGNLGDELAREINDESEAHDLGVDKVTEGGMKTLVAAMQDALQARETFQAEKTT